MTFYKSIDEADRLHYNLRAGDIVAIGGVNRMIVVTDAALLCDCGKGVMCPLNPQPTIDELLAAGGKLIARGHNEATLTARGLR